jgi:hypothetical protein
MTAKDLNYGQAVGWGVAILEVLKVVPHHVNDERGLPP